MFKQRSKKGRTTGQVNHEDLIEIMSYALDNTGGLVTARIGVAVTKKDRANTYKTHAIGEDCGWLEPVDVKTLTASQLKVVKKFSSGHVPSKIWKVTKDGEQEVKVNV